MTKTKLSYSSINTYTTCGEKYRLHYLEGYREKWQRASLLFGSAMDQALNDLLVNKDVVKAHEIFDKNWNFQFVNKKYTALKGLPSIVFSDADLDVDFVEITEEDKAWVKEFKDFKKTKKWNEIEEQDRIKYNTFCWESLKQKGHILIDSYNKKILPQFVRVFAVQHQADLTNSDGDTLVQFVDFCAELTDGSIVLMDNKTTSKMSYFSEEHAATSQQLISYFFNLREKFNLQAVGYAVMSKEILKNKEKKCLKCGFEGNESKARNCPNELPGKVMKRGKEVEEMVRCSGEWEVKLNPEADCKIFVSPVTETAIDLVLSTFDEANHGIKSKNYYKNLSVCGNQYGSKCVFYNKCWRGDDTNLVKKEE